MNKIYVICPYGLVTGGPDALHQIVYYLNKLNLNAFIVYSDIKNYKYKIPDEYKVYIDKYLLLKDIEDDSNSIIIVPETENNLLNRFSKLKKYIWWLSVDNDINSSGFYNKLLKVLKKIRLKNLKKIYKLNTLRIVLQHSKFDFQDTSVEHLCASHYAYDYVFNKVNDSKRVHYCIEPISKTFLELSNYTTENKENIILYNPKKNNKFTQKIIKAINDDNLKFIPLQGYSQSELIELYQKAKLYIDFGYFPGAERIPKEAVINGCCVITGKYGASNYYEDVPIKAEYKIDAIDSNIDNIKSIIYKILNTYLDIVNDFSEYREVVLNLENNFINQLKDIFIN